MATSTTWAFDLDVAQIIEQAYERIGSELRSGWDYRTARISLDLLMLEWQNRGLNLWTVKNASQTLTAGTADYILSNEKLDIVEATIRTDAGDVNAQTDLTMRRISVSSYAQQTNKLTVGRPIQYWVQRLPTGITITVWPVPDAVISYVLNYYYLERVEDTGASGDIKMDVPARFLPALIAGLAHQLALKTPKAAQFIPTLLSESERQWELAADSAREKATLRIVPGGY